MNQREFWTKDKTYLTIWLSDYLIISGEETLYKSDRRIRSGIIHSSWLEHRINTTIGSSVYRINFLPPYWVFCSSSLINVCGVPGVGWAGVWSVCVHAKRGITHSATLGGGQCAAACFLQGSGYYMRLLRDYKREEPPQLHPTLGDSQNCIVSELYSLLKNSCLHKRSALSSTEAGRERERGIGVSVYFGPGARFPDYVMFCVHLISNLRALFKSSNSKYFKSTRVHFHSYPHRRSMCHRSFRYSTEILFYNV